MTDSFKARTTLKVGAQQYDILSLAALKSQNVDRLPFSLKILLENLLRFEDGVNVTKADIEALLKGDAKAPPIHCSTITRLKFSATANAICSCAGDKPRSAISKWCRRTRASCTRSISNGWRALFFRTRPRTRRRHILTPWSARTRTPPWSMDWACWARSEERRVG